MWWGFASHLAVARSILRNLKVHPFLMTAKIRALLCPACASQSLFQAFLSYGILGHIAMIPHVHQAHPVSKPGPSQLSCPFQHP